MLGIHDTAAAERAAFSLRIRNRDLLKNRVVTRQTLRTVLQVYAYGKSESLRIRSTHRLGGGRLRHGQGKCRCIAAVGKLEQPHCGVVHLPCRRAVGSLDTLFVRVEALNDMVILARLASLPIRHPKTDGDLRHRLRVRRIERILSVVAEHSAVRVSESKDRL